MGLISGTGCSEEVKMGAETKIIVRVLRTHEETIEVHAVTRLEAEAEARRMEGVVAVLESGYPENIPNMGCRNEIEGHIVQRRKRLPPVPRRTR
jgi:hypothetical protein